MMTILDIISILKENTLAITIGVVSGAVVAIFTALVHLLTNTHPRIGISKEICHDRKDSLYRIKIRNNLFSNAKIVSANFIISCSTPGEKLKKDYALRDNRNILLYGMAALFCKKKNVKTFSTFILSAQTIQEDSIIRASSEMVNKYKANTLTINDFFVLDESAILTAIFEVQNYRTGVTRFCCRSYKKKNIVIGEFKSQRSLKIDDGNNSNNDVTG